MRSKNSHCIPFSPILQISSKSDWANLPEHLLDLILDKLAIDLRDYIRFGTICTTWKSCMLNHYTTNYHHPWLLLYCKSNPDDALRFYNLGTGEICESKVHIPQQFYKHNYRTFYGSCSYGWLFFMENNVLTISNPFTGVSFNLPALDRNRSEEDFGKVILSRDPSLGSFEVLISSYDNLLCHFKSGDEDWTYSEDWISYSFEYKNFIFTKNHILAIADPNSCCEYDLSLHIISRDFDPSKGTIKEIPRAPELSKAYHVISYFVETTDGVLLMVLRCYDFDCDVVDVEIFMTYKIYKLIGLGLEEQVELVPIENLGGD